MLWAWRRTLEVKRFGPVEYVDGIPQSSEEETVSGQYSVQPTPGRERELLPEGIRERDSYTLYGEPKLRTATEDTEADRVKIGGLWYEVAQVSNWDNGLLPHFKATVVLMPEQPDG